MNRWRRRLGLRCSHFYQPARLQDEGNYSCPRDLATLARADLAERRVARIVGADHCFKFPVEGGYLDLYNNNPFIRADPDHRPEDRLHRRRRTLRRDHRPAR